MSRTTALWILLALAVGALLGGAYSVAGFLALAVLLVALLGPDDAHVDARKRNH